MPEPDLKILVTDRPDSPKDASVLRTPAGEANLTIVTQSWWAQVLIRVGRTYLQGLECRGRCQQQASGWCF